MGTPQGTYATELEAIFGITRLGVAQADAGTRRFLRANPAFCAMTGYSEAELLAMSVTELNHPEDREEDQRQLQRLVSGETNEYQVEKRYVRKDGAVIWVSVNGNLLRDEEGRPSRTFAIIEDITERVNDHKALRFSEARFRLLVDQLPFSVQIVDARGNVVKVNRGFEKLWGITAKELANYNLLEDPQLKERGIYPFVARAFAGETVAVPPVLYVPDRGMFLGQERWTRAVIYPVLNEDGSLREVVLIHEDVTEMKRTEERLERTVAERTGKLRESVAELEHFSYTITHDMRAPLRAMQAFGEILRDEYMHCLDETARDYLRRIVESANRMDALITDTLNYAKMVQTELTLEPIDPGALLRGIVESYPQFQEPRAEIQIAEKLPLVMANRAGLTQCFSNLLGNAVKFVAPGVRPKVRVSAEARGEMVRLVVEDNGIGIPADQYERVFEMFQRMSRQYEGTGVGLALVRKVAEKMRGAVGCESVEGRGSRFWIDLRRAAG